VAKTGVESSTMPTRFSRAATIVLADDEWLFRESLRQLLIVPPPMINDVSHHRDRDRSQRVATGAHGEDVAPVIRLQ
jgi:hypothetical protein